MRSQIPPYEDPDMLWTNGSPDKEDWSKDGKQFGKHKDLD